MGYEISTAESPQKTIKYSMTRAPTPRKDSPIKFKQTKLKLVPFDTEKIIIEDNNIQIENNTEVVEVEKENELPTKISETYTDTMDIDEQIPDDSIESSNIIKTNSCARIDIIDELGLAQEIEITTDSLVPEDQQSLSSEDSDDASPIDVGTEDSGTQQDIFDGMDAKTNVTVIQRGNDNIQTVIQNNSIDSVKLNVTDDSVIAALPTKDDNLINMEDTVDIQNITGLNSTVNTDEIFCEKPIRSSTHAIENVAEQDTLSVTDSIFASLSSTQSIQNQEISNNAELDPEFLDSMQSIYPTLSSCMEPIDNIIERLTYPLWKHSLSMYFANRNMRTIGDFAQLSEREINRIPVRGKPKTEFVKKVLEHFESTCVLQTESSNKKSNEMEQLPTKTTDDEEPTVPIAVVSKVETESATINNESLIYNTPLIRVAENTSDNLSREDSPVENLDKTESVTSDMDISLEPMIPDNTDLSILDMSKKDVQKNAKIPIVAQILKPETSTINNNAEPESIPLSSENRYVIFYIFILK